MGDSRGTLQFLKNRELSSKIRDWLKANEYHQRRAREVSLALGHSVGNTPNRLCKQLEVAECG